MRETRLILLRIYTFINFFLFISSFYTKKINVATTVNNKAFLWILAAEIFSSSNSNFHFMYQRTLSSIRLLDIFLLALYSNNQSFGSICQPGPLPQINFTLELLLILVLKNSVYRVRHSGDDLFGHIVHADKPENINLLSLNLLENFRLI